MVVYNVEKINNYSGYSDTFKFEGSFEQILSEESSHQSVVVAVDAFDFSQQEQEQYKPFFVDREISKFLCGIQAAGF